MKFVQLVLGLDGSLCNYSCPWHRVHENHKRADNIIMWHIFTSTNNTTTILFLTQLWELLYTYHVIKQCTEKETTSLSNLLLHHFQKYFSYYFCGGNWSSQRNPQTCRKSLTNFITYCFIEYTSP
jgi:hypothetical protein